MDIKVAILEDEVLIAEDMGDIVRNLGYQIAGIFSNPNTLLEKIREINPSLVLSDINLGRQMDGIEVGKRLFEAGIPTIFITAYSDEETLKRALSFPVFGFLRKPLEVFSLKSAIEIAINNFKHYIELKEEIKKKEEEYEKLSKKLKAMEKELLEEERLRENLLIEKDKLSKEIASFEYYAKLLREQIDAALIEKERIQGTKNEIFTHLNNYAKGMEFLNKLFCGVLDKEEDFQKILMNISDNFIEVLGNNCKGVEIKVNDIVAKNEKFILTPFVYKNDFNSKNITVEINLYYNTEENLKNDLTKSVEYFVDVFLKLLTCFSINRISFIKEQEDKFLFKRIFDNIPFPLIFVRDNVILLNQIAKEFFNIQRDKDFIKCLEKDEKMEQEIKKKFLIEKIKIFDFNCKFRLNDGIIEYRVKRIFISDNIYDYLDMILV